MAIQTTPVDALVAFVYFVLLGFLQIRYPDNPTPFQLHPKTIMLSVASFLAYCFASLCSLKFPTRLHHFETLMHVFVSLSLFSLVLLLLPDSWESFDCMMYTLWFITLVLAIIIRVRYREIWLQSQQRRSPLLPTTSVYLT